MSKVTRHTPKQIRSTHKQNTGPAAKQGQPTSKQTTSQSPKEDSPVSKQATSQTTKETSPVSKQATTQISKQAQNGKGTNQPAEQAPSKQMLRRSAMLERRQEEQKRREAERQRTVQKKRLIIGSIVAVALLLVGVLGYVIYNNATHPSKNSGASSGAVDPRYPTIDNVACDRQEQLAFHIHAHVSIFINGQAATIPAGLGIGGDASQPSCFYWMHTHSADGLIHMEGPGQFTPKLGDFLDIWGQSFPSMQYRPELDQKGGDRWQVYVDGKLVSGDFHNIVLQAHTLVTLAYNSPDAKPDTTFNWNGQ